MKNLYQLIKICRTQTENDEYSNITGIQDSEFESYLNDAQRNIQAAIVKQHPKVFITEKVISVQAGVEKYNIPSDCFLGNKIFNVEYSPTGNLDDYYVINEDIMKYRSSGVDGSPTRYIRVSGKILLSPVPAESGKLRINYVRALPDLRFPLGYVESISQNSFDINGVTGTYSTINFSSQNLDKSVTISDIKYDRVYSICNGLGEVVKTDIFRKDRTISFHPSNLNVEPTGSSIKTESFTSETNLEGHYLMPGANSTYIPNIDPSIERYLISYCNWKILKRDSSVDSSEAIQELQLMTDEIVSSYANISDDIQLIPQLNAWDDWSV